MLSSPDLLDPVRPFRFTDTYLPIKPTDQLQTTTQLAAQALFTSEIDDVLAREPCSNCKLTQHPVLSVYGRHPQGSWLILTTRHQVVVRGRRGVSWIPESPAVVAGSKYDLMAFLLHKSGGAGHWMAVTRGDDRQFYLMDDAEKPVPLAQMSRSAFKRTQKGVVLALYRRVTANHPEPMPGPQRQGSPPR